MNKMLKPLLIIAALFIVVSLDSCAANRCHCPTVKYRIR
ncbi:hypothetical protein SAMN06265350_104287 [Solitalea koreensis]|uniref:Uncharacterized protein n=1 Tax=Solitalea koreensis TaxID=543615 RepID=A0A521CRT5_9SPHI|nr:hypothetical protein SAMN06265350_104287 [Solitalea koreensis]